MSIRSGRLDHDLDDQELLNAAGRVNTDRLADAGLQKRLAHRAGDGDLDVVGRRRGRGLADELVEVLVAVALLAQLDGRADEYNIADRLRHLLVNDADAGEALLEAADLGLFHALLLAGGVVVAILAEVAVGPRLGDAARHGRPIGDEPGQALLERF